MTTPSVRPSVACHQGIRWPLVRSVRFEEKPSLKIAKKNDDSSFIPFDRASLPGSFRDLGEAGAL